MTNSLQLPQQGQEGRGSRAEQQTAVSMVFLVIVSCRRAFCNGKASSVTSDSEIETVWRPDYTKPLDSLLTINTRIKTRQLFCKINSLNLQQPFTYRQWLMWVKAWLKKWSEVTQSCPTLCDRMDYSLPGSSHGIFQARILDWVAISFSRGSFPPRDWTWVSHIVGRGFIVWATKGMIQCIKTPQTFWFLYIRFRLRFSDELTQVTNSSKRHLPK